MLCVRWTVWLDMCVKWGGWKVTCECVEGRGTVKSGLHISISAGLCMTSTCVLAVKDRRHG